MEKFPKPHREEYEKLLKNQEEEKGEFIKSAHEEALESEKEIKTSKNEKAAETVSFEQAREIMGKDFLGSEAVENVYGVKLEIPEIKASKEELETAKELGQQLILYIDEMKSGSITMKNLKKEFPKGYDDNPIFFKQKQNLDDEDFFKKEKPRIGWKLVSKDVIPDSKGKNYLEQTEIAIDYLKSKVFKDQELPEEYQKAIAEFESKKSSIRDIIDSNWQKAAEELENLQITQLTREAPVEMAYRLVLNNKENKEKLFSGNFYWPSRLFSDGRMVYVGALDDRGAVFLDFKPGYRFSSLGLSFSRSL